MTQNYEQWPDQPPGPGQFPTPSPGQPSPQPEYHANQPTGQLPPQIPGHAPHDAYGQYQANPQMPMQQGAFGVAAKPKLSGIAIATLSTMALILIWLVIQQIIVVSAIKNLEYDLIRSMQLFGGIATILLYILSTIVGALSIRGSSREKIIGGAALGIGAYGLLATIVSYILNAT